MPEPEVVRDEVLELVTSRFMDFLQEFSSVPESGVEGGTEMSYTGTAGSQGQTQRVKDYVQQVG